jgi:hypothetical protein
MMRDGNIQSWMTFSTCSIELSLSVRFRHSDEQMPPTSSTKHNTMRCQECKRNHTKNHKLENWCVLCDVEHSTRAYRLVDTSDATCLLRDSTSSLVRNGVWAIISHQVPIKALVHENQSFSLRPRAWSSSEGRWRGITTHFAH